MVEHRIPNPNVGGSIPSVRVIERDYMNFHDFEIVKTEVTKWGITATLNNGVVISLSSNPESVHLSFSRVEAIKPAYFHSANTIDINYKVSEHIR